MIEIWLLRIQWLRLIDQIYFRDDVILMKMSRPANHDIWDRRWRRLFVNP